MIEPIPVNYVNWKGSERVRQIVPISVRFGSTEFHPVPQWLLKALDPEDNQEKEFALSQCDFLSVNNPAHREDAMG
jgi:hypothetical protein